MRMESQRESSSQGGEDIVASPHFDDLARSRTARRRLIAGVLAAAAVGWLLVAQPWQPERAPTVQAVPTTSAEADPTQEWEQARTRVQDVHFTDLTTGYAAVTDCAIGQPTSCATTIAGTSDGGRTWQHRSVLPIGSDSVPIGTVVRFVHATASELTVLATTAHTELPALDASAVLLRSTDGGLTWLTPVAVHKSGRAQPLPADEPIFVLSRSDCLVFGWVCVRDVAWLDLTTAELVDLPVPRLAMTEGVQVARAADANLIFVAGAVSIQPLRIAVLSSADNGRTWEQLQIETGDIGTSDYALALTATDDGEAYLSVTRDSRTHAQLYRITDAGQSSTQVVVLRGKPDLQQLLTVGTTLLALSTSDGELWMSTDRGSRWYVVPGAAPYRVIVTGAGKVWVGVSHDQPTKEAILMTTDAGETWAPVTLP